MVTNRWVRAARAACAVVLALTVAGVVAPAAGAHVRPTFQAHAEWPSTTRCTSDLSYVDASRPPSWSEPTQVEVRIWHSATGEPGCRPVRETSIDGHLKPSTFWVAPDASRGRLVASGWVPCAGAGCGSRWVHVRIDAWFRHDDTSTAGPFGSIAWGTVTVGGCVVSRGWSDNSETTMSYGPL